MGLKYMSWLYMKPSAGISQKQSQHKNTEKQRKPNQV